jgi:hypothetical protein
MHPSERVRIVVETARAILDGRLAPDDALAALRLQEEQVAPHLRSDRLDVTQSEADSVALTLRRLGEQVGDLGPADHDPEATAEVARILGQLAQTLR